MGQQRGEALLADPEAPLRVLGYQRQFLPLEHLDATTTGSAPGERLQSTIGDVGPVAPLLDPPPTTTPKKEESSSRDIT